MSRKNNKYTKEFKLRAVDMYINQEMSAVCVAQTLNIKSKTQVQKWVELYKAKGDTAFDEETRGRALGSKKGRPKTKFDSLEEEIKYLRMENEFLKKLHALSGKKK